MKRCYKRRVLFCISENVNKSKYVNRKLLTNCLIYKKISYMNPFIKGTETEFLIDSYFKTEEINYGK